MTDVAKLSIKPIRTCFRAACVGICLSEKARSPYLLTLRFRLVCREVFLPRPVVLPTVTPEIVPEKRFSQVESLVLPQAVIPNSCELKLKDKTAHTGKRPSPIPVRATEEQKAIIREKARAAGITVNRFILVAALGSDYQPPADPELTRALLALNKELTVQGNNLNQIARQLNGNIITPTQGESMLDVIGRSMLQTHRAVRQVLSHGEYEP